MGVSLLDCLKACAAHLPEAFRTAHARLFEDELGARLADRLVSFLEQGIPTGFPLPHFAAECTPPLAQAYEPFREGLTRWQSAGDRLAPEGLRDLAGALVKADTPLILVLLGQRRTPASITDIRALPPSRRPLLAAAHRLHGEGDSLTVAGRALTKHVPRSTEAFWGEVRGPTAVKNERAGQLLDRILDQATWWNVFGHFQHETVYEVRVPTGHGARWGREGEEFIGFLEPFDEERCPSLDNRLSQEPG